MLEERSICLEAKPEKVPDPVLKLFQFTGSSVGAATFYQFSKSLLPIWPCEKDAPYINIKEIIVAILVIVNHLEFKQI